MALEPPIRVQKLQTALQVKAKESPGYRFYLLYDKLYRKDVLEYAYRCCKANQGAAGVDGRNLRTSRRTAGSAGWVNWRIHCAGRRIKRKQLDGCGYPKRVTRTNCDPWGSLASWTAWS